MISNGQLVVRKISIRSCGHFFLYIPFIFEQIVKNVLEFGLLTQAILSKKFGNLENRA